MQNAPCGGLMLLRAFISVAAYVPVTITAFDVFGYVVKVDGASMQPILNPDLRNGSGTDWILVSRWSTRKFEVQRGDIVCLMSPRNPDQQLVKRVVGVEGDLIKSLSYKKRFIRIASGQCWVEGENHGHSMDSNLFGPVPLGLVTAKALCVVWPPSRWRRLEHSLGNRKPVTQSLAAMLIDDSDLD